MIVKAGANERPGRSSVLAPFVPRLVFELDVARVPSVTQTEGTLVFSDVSGFTAMSERLARKGRVGAEEVTDIISATFTDLLGVAADTGGGLVKFGGDALLLCFTGSGHEARATHAALGMRASLRTMGAIDSSAGGVRLRLSTGVASGPLVVGIVGSTSVEVVMAGPVVDDVLACETAASAGQVVMAPATAAALPARCRGHEVGPGHLAVRDPGAPSFAPAPSDDIDWDRFVPLALRRHLLSGGGFSEHRQAAVGFVVVDGFQAALRSGPQVWLDRVHSTIERAQAACEAQGVGLLATDAAPDGMKLILTAGVPDARGEDEDRLVAAARAIVEGDPPFPTRAGIHSGPVFAGLVGPHYRRAYTVMGDTVNTAARVAHHATSGQVLASPELLDRSRSRYEVEWLEPFAAKGKSRLLRTALVGERVDSFDLDVAEDAPLVGRGPQLDELVSVVGEAVDGAGGSVAVVGPAGAGASRLVRELADRLDGARWLTATTSTADQGLSFHAVRPLIIGLLGLGPREVAEADLRAAVKRIDPSAVRWTSLLAPIVGADVEDDEAVAGLEPRERAARQIDAVRLIAQRVFTQPTVMLIDHIDEADPASLRVAQALASACADRPAVLLVTARTAPQWIRRSVVLPPLDRAASEDLAIRAAAGHLQVQAAKGIARRAEGIPMLVIELTRAVVAGTPVDELPDSLERLATARIDALSPDRRGRLRALSTLGGSFPLDDVGLLIPGVPDALRGLQGLLVIEGQEARFSSSIMWSAAYQGLSARERRRLHERMSTLLNGASGRVEARAIHASEARVDECAWELCREAAARTRDAAAFEASAAFLRRALASAGRLSTVDPLEKGRTVLELGLMEWVMGDIGQARVLCRRASRLVKSSPSSWAQANFQLGLLDLDCNRPAAALRRFRAGVRALASAPDSGPVHLVRRLILGEAHAQSQLGRHRRAIDLCLALISSGESASDPIGVAHANNYMSLALYALHDPRAVDAGRAALAGFEAAGDVRTQASALNNLSNAYERFGRLGDAARCLRRAVELAADSDSGIQGAIAEFNLARVLCQQGRLGEAELHFERTGQTFAAAGLAYALVARLGMASVALRRGDLEAARAAAAESAGPMKEAGLMADEAHLLEVELALAAGDATGALALLEEEIKDEPVTAARLRATALTLAGRAEEAGRAHRQALAMAVESRDAFNELLIRVNLSRLTGEPDGDVGLLTASLEVEQLPEVVLVQAG